MEEQKGGSNKRSHQTLYQVIKYQLQKKHMSFFHIFGEKKKKRKKKKGV